MRDEDENGALARLKQPISHEIGQSLDSLSVAEIGERIAALTAEIARLEDMRRAKQDAQTAAASFFKI